MCMMHLTSFLARCCLKISSSGLVHQCVEYAHDLLLSTISHIPIWAFLTTAGLGKVVEQRGVEFKVFDSSSNSICQSGMEEEEERRYPPSTTNPFLCVVGGK